MKKAIQSLLLVVLFPMIMMTVIFMGNGFNEHNVAHFLVGLGFLVLCGIDYAILYVSVIRR